MKYCLPERHMYTENQLFQYVYFAVYPSSPPNMDTGYPSSSGWFSPLLSSRFTLSTFFVFSKLIVFYITLAQTRCEPETLEVCPSKY